MDAFESLQELTKNVMIGLYVSMEGHIDCERTLCSVLKCTCSTYWTKCDSCAHVLLLAVESKCFMVQTRGYGYLYIHNDNDYHGRCNEV